MLAAKDIVVRFGTLTALNKANLDIQTQSFHGLIGPNGSGKSTLLKSIAGAITPNEGQIVLNGKDITHAAPALRLRSGLSFKFQITSVLTQLTVYDNLLLACQAQKGILSQVLSRSKDELNAQIEELLAYFHLEAVADETASALSHGQQQWLEIAMAMACKPNLLLLDEPTAGMSPQERRATGDLLQTIRETCSLLIVEHDLDFVRDICDTLTVLDQGQIIASGSTTDVQKDPTVRKVYLSHA